MSARPRIESLGVALPDHRMTMAEVVSGCRVELKYPLETWTGIQAHRHAAADQFSTDLARRAVELCLARSRYRPDDIDLVINCNISRVEAPGRWRCEPGGASLLASWFGMGRALAFDIANACAGMFTGLWLASDFIATGRVKRALIFSGEYVTHILETAQREIEGDFDDSLSCLTLGDAGAALILDAADPSAGVGFDLLDMRTIARYSRLCLAGPTFKPEGGAIMRTDSLRLASMGTREAVRHMQLVLTGRRVSDFDHVISHQTSLASLTSGMKTFNEAFGAEELHEGNLVVNLAERGNTATTTHFVALWDLIHDGRIRSGDRILFSTIASGVVVGVGAYTLDDLPDRLLNGGSHATPPASGPALARAATALDPAGGGAPAKATWSSTPSQDFPSIRIEALGVAGPSSKTDTLTLCRVAGEAAFRASSYGRKDFSHLVFTGVYRTDFIMEPAIASLVAKELRMNEVLTSPERSTFAFDLDQGATGFLTACEVARQLVAARPERRIMVVSAELDPNTKTRPDLPLSIEPSGAAAVLDASPDPARGLRSVIIRRFPEQVDALVSEINFGIADAHAVRKGLEVATDFLVEQLPLAISDLLQLEGIAIDDVDALFVPELVPGLRRRVVEVLKIDPRRAVDPPEERVQRYACSLPYLLHHARNGGGVVADGDIGLCVEMGSGLQIACAVYRF